MKFLFFYPQGIEDMKEYHKFMTARGLHASMNVEQARFETFDTKEVIGKLVPVIENSIKHGDFSGRIFAVNFI